MKKAKAKILVLFCGGTIVMEKNFDGLLAPPCSQKALDSLIGLEPRLLKEVDLTTKFISNIDSSNMTYVIWDEIARVIEKEYQEYDGFVVTQGTDTMAFTSSALSLSLHHLGKPVVCTGAQIPGFAIESDARLNFVNAVRLAQKDVSGVMLLFGTSIFHGARVTKISHANLEGFASVNVSKLGKIGTKMILSSTVHKRYSGKLRLCTGFDPRIFVLHLFPGASLDFFTSLLAEEIKGIVLIAYGTGNLPETHLPFLIKAQEKQIPVVIHSQCLEGTTQMHTYETGKKALSCGVIEGYDMSLETTVVKLMWVLDKKVPYEKVREALHQNLVGEIGSNF